MCRYVWAPRLILGFWLNFSREGQTGLGKSTLVNTIFASHLIDSKGRLAPDEPVRSTTEIQAVSHSTCGYEGLYESSLERNG